jgi:zinc/manganese transport system substrate-binding protein
MQKAIDADPTPAITVNAFMAAGDDETRNEHIWYDVDQVGDVAAVIGAAIESVDKTKFPEVEANVADFRKKIAERKARLDTLRISPKKVFLTEPLVAYLVEDAGYLNLTPSTFSDAVEEDRDIPPAVVRQAIELIKLGEVDAILVNNTTQTPQVESLLSVNLQIPNYGFSELLNQDPDTQHYSGGYFEMLDSAIKTLEGK